MSSHPRARKFITPMETPWAQMQVAAKRRGRQKKGVRGCTHPCSSELQFPWANASNQSNPRQSQTALFKARGGEGCREKGE